MFFNKRNKENNGLLGDIEIVLLHVKAMSDVYEYLNFRKLIDCTSEIKYNDNGTPVALINFSTTDKFNAFIGNHCSYNHNAIITTDTSTADLIDTIPQQINKALEDFKKLYISARDRKRQETLANYQDLANHIYDEIVNIPAVSKAIKNKLVEFATSDVQVRNVKRPADYEQILKDGRYYVRLLLTDIATDKRGDYLTIIINLDHNEHLRLTIDNAKRKITKKATDIAHEYLSSQLLETNKPNKSVEVYLEPNQDIKVYNSDKELVYVSATIPKDNKQQRDKQQKELESIVHGFECTDNPYMMLQFAEHYHYINSYRRPINSLYSGKYVIKSRLFVTKETDTLEEANHVVKTILGYYLFSQHKKFRDNLNEWFRIWYH